MCVIDVGESSKPVTRRKWSKARGCTAGNLDVVDIQFLFTPAFRGSKFKPDVLACALFGTRLVDLGRFRELTIGLD